MTSPKMIQGRGRLCGLKRIRRPAPFPGLGWFAIPAGDAYRAGVSFPLSTRTESDRFLWFDILLEGPWFATFVLVFKDGPKTAECFFSPLNECQTRQVFSIPPGSWKSVTLAIQRKPQPSAQFYISPLTCSPGEPAQLVRPVLPRGPLMDELGQSRLHDWDGKQKNGEALVRHLGGLYRQAPRRRWPASYSRWGGWRKSKIKASGFFQTHHDGRRWWLVDPDGYLFWSSGLDCVHASIDNESKVETRFMRLDRAHTDLPNVLGPAGRCFRLNPWHGKDDREFNYLEANFVRAFGPERAYDHWIRVAHGELRRLGFNTAGDWSDEYAARREGTPYARALERNFNFPRTPLVGPQMPDVFLPSLDEDAREFAESLRESRTDPGMLGYFMHNEPPWGWHEAGVAGTMLETTPVCQARRVLAGILRRKYGDSAGLRKAWGMGVSLRDIAEGEWNRTFSPAAIADLQKFSTVMLSRLLESLSHACRRVDPHHLNLGIRWWTYPPIWALKAMGSCDVVSFNYYLPRIDRVGYGRSREPGVDEVAEGLNRPFLVGEWHFGAFDAGLPAAGLYRTANQTERGKAFRYYAEHAMSLPWCVGTHWFSMYDRNVLYCPTSNENGNHGFYSGTHTPHRRLCEAAQRTHARMYEVVSGRIAPYAEPAQFLFPSR